MKEIWKDIPRYEGLYQASNLGRIRSLRRKIMLKYSINRGGYPMVTFSYKNKRKTFTVHRLVAIVFLGNSKLPTINHKNGIKTDNRVKNLEFSSLSDNIKHAFRTGLREPVILTGEDASNHKLTWKIVSDIRKSNKSGAELGREYNVDRMTISEILRNKSWKKQ